MSQGPYLGSTKINNGSPTFISATGTGSAVALTSAAGSFIQIYNNSGANITADHGAATTTFIIPNATTPILHLRDNANELRLNITNAQTVSMEVWG